MPGDERHVEISIGVNSDGVQQGLSQVEQDLTNFQRKAEQLAGGSFDPSLASKVAPFTPSGMPTGTPGGVFGASAPMPQPTTDPGIPVGGTGRLDELRGQFSSIQQFAGSAPDVAGMGLSRLQTSALNASVADPGMAKEYQELIDSIKGLRGTIQDDGKKKDGIGELLQWAKLQSAMQLGSQVMGQAQGGNLLSAAGTGLGGAIGMLFGPVGMGVGATMGGGIGGFVESLAGGAGGARDYEKNITDMNQRFGVGNLGALRNYRQGEQSGYTAEESAGLTDRLRENRAISDPAQAGPMVRAVQELTRALGLNVEATAEMVGLYSRTGGEKGAEGARGYLADVVGGAIRSGFESNIQQYADVMGSARMQSVQSTGQGVSDRAFGMLQDVFAGLTGGSSRTAGLFRDNAQMAGAGLQSFMGYGGTSNPYSTSAAYMRLAGIGEAQLDTRFNDSGQILQNAQRSLGFTTNRLQQMSGMSASEFQSAAAADPNFVQGLIGNNVGLQRQTASIVSGFLGRDATAQDLRAYEELTNLSAANGGKMPTGGGAGAARVEELMKQLQASPADEMRQKEAAAHNATMEAMSNFMGLQTRIDAWTIGIFEWLQENVDLKAIEKRILDGMTQMERGAKWLLDNAPKWGANIKSMSDRVIKWANDNNLLPGLKAGFDGMMAILKGAFGIGQAAAGVVGDSLAHPATQYGMRQLPRAMAGIVSPGLPLAGNILRMLGLGRGEADDAFNDTPTGGVMAGPGYNTFRFAPGDVVTARQGATAGGATLTDINLSLIQGHALDSQKHQENQEQRKSLQDVVDKVYMFVGKAQADIETLTAKYVPYLMETSFALVTAAGVRDGLLAKIEAYFPTTIAAIESVRDAVTSMIGSMGAGGAGAGGGGGGVDPGIAAKIVNEARGWEGQDFRAGVFAQCAFFVREIFKNAGTELGVAGGSSPGLAGSFFNESVGAMHHTTDPNSIPAGAIVGFENTYNGPGSGVGGFTHVGIATGDGRMVDRSTSSRPVRERDITTFRPDSRGGYTYVIPNAMQAPDTPVGAVGRGGLPDLGSGYESLEALAGELSSRDPRFNPSTPEGRAALVLGLGIGGSEVYSRGSTARDFFTRRGGTGNNMLGFGQYNLAYHRAGTSTPDAYADFFADMMTGQRAQPNGRAGQNWAGQLSQAVQGGSIQSGAQLEQWMRRQGIGGSNWQGVDDGWGRVPGLSDQLLQYLRQPGGGGNTRASAGGAPNITVNIASARDRAEAEAGAREGVLAAASALDEFEQRRRVNPNPRNQGGLSPVYG